MSESSRQLELYLKEVTVHLVNQFDKILFENQKLKEEVYDQLALHDKIKDLESKLAEVKNLLKKDDIWILYNLENWLIILRKVE